MPRSAGAETVLRVRDAGDAIVGEWSQLLGTLLPGAEVTVTREWTSTGSAAGTYRAEVEVEHDAAIVASAQVAFELAPEAVFAELTASKTAAVTVDHDGDGIASPGDELGYLVTVQNRGTGAALNVVFDDQVPEHTTLVAGSVVTSRGAVTSDDPIAVAVGEIAPDESVEISFAVVVDAALPPEVTAVTNQGLVNADGIVDLPTDDPSTVTPVDATVTPLVSRARLEATMVDGLAADHDGDGLPSPGDELGYTVTVANTGNAPADGVGFRDLIPQHTSVVPGSVITSAGTVTDEAAVEVELGELAAGGEVTIEFRLLVANPVPAGLTQVSNQGVVSSATLPVVLTDDPELGGSSDPTLTTIVAAPVLVAEKTDALAVDADGDGRVDPGDTVEYAVVIRNLGNTSANDVTLSDELPALAALVPGSVTTTRGTVVSEIPVVVNAGEIAGGSDVTVSFRVTVDSPVPAGVESISNQGLVTSAELDEILTDDPEVGGSADPTVTAIASQPVLRAEKVDVLLHDVGGDGEVSPGDVVLYQITISNSGNTAATGVELHDPVPAYTSLVAGSVQSSQGTVLSEEPVAVALGEIADGAAATVSFQVEIAPLPIGLSTVSNQGLISSVELPQILTDDPDTPEADDATLTEVAITPEISIAAATVTEGDAGTVDAVFTVTLATPSDREIRVDYATAAQTATAEDDYTSVSGTLILAAGSTQAAIAVPVVGDVVLETDETFVVELSNAVNTAIVDPTGVGTILDDEVCAGPNLLLNPGAEAFPEDGEIPGWIEVEGGDWQQRFADPEPAEGAAYFFAGGVEYAELIQDVDVGAYAARIAAGGQLFEFRGFVRTFDEVPPDVARIVVEYRNATNGVALEAFDSGEIASPYEWYQAADVHEAPVGTGWIRVRLLATRFTAGPNDGYFDGLSLRSLRAPTLVIDDVRAYEGDQGITEALFTAALSCPFEQAVSAAYATVDGSAEAGSDYLAAAGSITVAVGATAETIPVVILSDEDDEPHETFGVELSGLSTAGDPVLLDPVGVGTIVNDDFCARSHGYWKNHTEVWPVDWLVLGGVEYDAAELLAMLKYKGPDASSKLALQLVATKLNLAQGSDPIVVPTVEEADAFLAEYPPGSDPRGSERQEANRIKDELDDYNNSCHDD